MGEWVVVGVLKEMIFAVSGGNEWAERPVTEPFFSEAVGGVSFLHAPICGEQTEAEEKWQVSVCTHWTRFD